MSTPAKQNDKNLKESPWEKSSVTNLVRWKASGIYYVRAKVGNRLIRKSLDTSLMSVARNRLEELLKQERERQVLAKPGSQGKLAIGQAIRMYLERLNGDAELKPSTKKYRHQCVAAIQKTWPALNAINARKITKSMCQEWARKFRVEGTKFRPPGAKKERTGISPSRFNSTVTTLRQIMNIAVEEGALPANPVVGIKRAREHPKLLELPSNSQFAQFIQEIETSGAGQAKDCADLVRGLAFSGCRIGEAIRIRWHDIQWEKDEVIIKGDPVTGTKNWEFRYVPMIPQLRQLFARMRQERQSELPDTPVFRVRECQKSMDRAAALIGMPRITHHDLRHLFATTAIESGIDIPTVSRLLGHKDGGVLAMKTYGHLRQEHAKEAVQKIKFF